MQIENGLSFFSRVNIKPVNDLGKELFPSPLNPPEIVEISGQAGVGKSLLCLDLMATALLPKTIFDIDIGGLATSAIFIDCDKHFSILHFADLLERKIKRKCHKVRKEWKCLGKEKQEEQLMTINKKDFNTKIEETIKMCLKNLYYFNCSTSNQFSVTLLSLEQCLSSKSNISLVFIDSISAYYWYDRIYKVDNWYKMELYLNNIFHSFINIIKKHYLVCFCTKQSLFKYSKEREAPDNLAYENMKGVESTTYEFLGKEWINGVTVKINMYLDVPSNNGNSDRNGDSDCIIETIQGEKSKSSKWSFHDDGLRLIEITSSLH